MARVLEHHGKRILAEYGIPIPRGTACAESSSAASFASELGSPVILKALVPVGGRQKAGGVLMAETPSEAQQAATQLLGSHVKGYPILELLVEERLSVAQEFYASVVLDRNALKIMIMCSKSGGVEFEDRAKRGTDLVQRLELDPRRELQPFQARQLWAELGVSGPVLLSLTDVLLRLFRLFRATDALLLEINPLALTTKGGVVALDCMLELDEGGLGRHPQLREIAQGGGAHLWRPLTALEREAEAVRQMDGHRGSSRYIELEGGNIGFIAGGGGGSLVYFDALVDAGGSPANYSELGGNPTEEKVAALARIVLKKPGVRGLFVGHNITNNTQVSVLARGVVRALQGLNLDPDQFPVVAREAGLYEEEGAAIFRTAGVRYFGAETSMTEAARQMVLAMSGRGDRVGYPR